MAVRQVFLPEVTQRHSEVAPAFPLLSRLHGGSGAVVANFLGFQSMGRSLHEPQ